MNVNVIECEDMEKPAPADTKYSWDLRSKYTNLLAKLEIDNIAAGTRCKMNVLSNGGSTKPIADAYLASGKSQDMFDAAKSYIAAKYGMRVEDLIVSRSRVNFKLVRAYRKSVAAA